MATTLFIGKDLNGTPCDTIHVSEDMYRCTLPAGVEKTVTVPPNVDTVYFAFGGTGSVWVDIGHTVTLPSSTMTLTTSELNPVSRFVIPGQVIHLICVATNDVQVCFVNANLGRA